MNAWRARHLTIFGRITNVKTLGVSQIMYNASVLHVPDSVIKAVERMLYHFVWNSKCDKVKRDTMIGDYNEGRVRMIDIQSQIKALKVMWVKRLCDNSQGSWKYLAKNILSPYGGVPLIFQFNCLPADIVKMMDRSSCNVPKFYTDLLRFWFEIKDQSIGVSGLQLDATEIRNQIIWGNSLIRINGNPIIIRHWIESGIVFVGDFCPYVFVPCKDILNQLTSKRNHIAETFQIRKAIPNIWITKLKADTLPQFNAPNIKEIVVNSENNTTVLRKLKTKAVYNMFVKKKRMVSRSKIYWKTIFQLPHDFNWKQVWSFKIKKSADE